MALEILHREPGTQLIPAGAPTWRTCLREISFSNGAAADRSPAESARRLSEGEAYRLLLEILCGLQSPMLGETQVMGQFKAFLATLGHDQAWLGRLGQRLLADAREIRTKYLQGLGSRSYGSAVRRHLAACRTPCSSAPASSRRKCFRFSPTTAGRSISGGDAKTRPPRTRASTYRTLDQIDDTIVPDAAVLIIAAPVPSDVVARVAARYVALQSRDRSARGVRRATRCTSPRPSSRSRICLRRWTPRTCSRRATSRPPARTSPAAAVGSSSATSCARSAGTICAREDPQPRERSGAAAGHARRRARSRRGCPSVDIDAPARARRLAIATTTTPLAALPDKGAFTADLSDALARAHADLVVHSWKDLPLEDRAGTTVAATLERADPRDVLLVRRDVVAARPRTLTILSSSPRRAWLLEQALPELLPWRVEARRSSRRCAATSPTRLARLVEGRGDALVVAKAALDRLLGFGAPFEAAAQTVRALLDQCVVDGAAAARRARRAGAGRARRSKSPRAIAVCAIELAAISHRPTWEAVRQEREVLARHGGGCHEALGATVLPREYGRVVCERRTIEQRRERRRLVARRHRHRAADEREPTEIWPRPDERERATRRPLDVAPPAERRRLLGRARRGAARLVDRDAGSARLGRRRHDVAPAGRARRLGARLRRRPRRQRAARHRRARRASGVVAPPDASRGGVRRSRRARDLRGRESLPDDLPARTHFFWTSGTLFLRGARRAGPSSRPLARQRAGPHVAHALPRRLGIAPGASVWLDYEQWQQGDPRMTRNG